MFVIYHIASTVEVGPTPHGHPHSLYAKTYKTYGAAKRTMAKFNAASGVYGPGPYGAASVEHYNKAVVKMVEKTNLIGGGTYMEASNTPGYLSPSSEAYWTM